MKDTRNIESISKMERRAASKSLIVCSVLVSGSVILTALVFLTKPSLAETFRSNMVVIIQVLSLVLFIPLSCVVYCMDRQKQKLLKKEMNVKRRLRTLTFDEDKRQVKSNKMKKLPPKLVPAPPEAVYYRMG
uniref:Uncharacterized protein n=1 Tax=Magallana gigas TaxID=29159 RepID=A0A8W8J3V1_MAGGI|nr:uncharacterized protein LOC105336846 isoform X2 [Crassostrea gigas]XP_034333641.1 uncharacterized protein LOC105336846 isoform X1 [Crassostrea gigas]XP_034333642.1 uncharacterized protein LOC105336846 isoform X1 [Crassostrea gigas]XP_034333643.1 uncharacterized protein LOC105336846 isoform X1 [Crassostrea gigas]XP_034333644.1 uncharacterized protein LOC105336846 isoform X1 [Crassostrea gigas]XP_034333645.1 uncharacterized protein LOC105336846 isoform X1 [Crassostrea gigas]XP_034333646.1 un